MSARILYQAGDQTLLRQINLSAILNHIRVNAPISRSTLAIKTGLNKATITSLVSELIQKQFIQEVGLETNLVGRPSMKLNLNPGAGFILSSEIGVDFISVIGTDFSPKIIHSEYQTFPSTFSVDEVMALLVQFLNKTRAICAEKVSSNFLGLALGVPGLVDHGNGKLLFAPNLRWNDVPLRDILRPEFSAPIFVDNEGNLATLGEYYFGSADQHDDVLYISVGIGLGGGMLRGGNLMRGLDGMAGEFGHMTVDPDGLLCSCGNYGCWETQASEKGLFRYTEEAILAGESSILPKSNGSQSSLTIHTIVEAARAGDKVALNAVEKVGHNLGIGIASLINALNPGVVVFGGMMSMAWEFLEPVIKEEISRRALYWNREGTQVVLARHGMNACVMGGVATVYQAILARPTNH
jgi:glucokinase-like ROK family protein